MANIEAHIRVRDDMSPALSKIIKNVNNVLSKLNVVYTETGKVTKSFHNAADAQSNITKEIQLSGKELARINKINADIRKSEADRAIAERQLFELNKLNADVAGRVKQSLEAQKKVTQQIAQLNAQNEYRLATILDEERKLKTMRESGKSSLEAIGKKEAYIKKLTEGIKGDELKIKNLTSQRAVEEERCKQILSGEQSFLAKLTQLQSKNNVAVAREEVLRQEIVAICQKAINAEAKRSQIVDNATRKQIAAEQKLAESMNKKWKAEQDGIMKAQQSMGKLIQAAEDQKKRELQARRMLSQWADNDDKKRIVAIERQKQLQQLLANKELMTLQQKQQATQRFYESVLSASKKLYAQEERQRIQKAAAEQRDQAKKLAAYNALKAKTAEMFKVQQDFTLATKNVTAELKKSLQVETAILKQEAKATEVQKQELNLNRQLSTEKARLRSLTASLVNTQARINTLNRTGNTDAARMNSLLAKRSQLSNQISGQQRRILSIQNQLKNKTDQTANAQRKHNEYIRSGVGEANRLLSTLKNVASVYALMRGAQNTVGLADTVTNTKARLNIINDKFGNKYDDGELQQMLYESSMRSRSSYLDNAKIVGSMGIRAAEAFGDPAEIVQFTETLSKMGAIAGTSSNEITNAMYQINQAMGAGKFQGDEFKSVSENLPTVMDAISKYMGKPESELKELSKEGKITAAVFKNAILSAANDVNAEFAKMPVTWGQMWTTCKNYMLKVSDSILAKISSIVSSERFAEFINSAAFEFKKLMVITEEVFDKMTAGIAHVYDNWKAYKPIVIGVTAAILAYKAATTASIVISAIQVRLDSILAARKLLVAGATKAQAAQQVGLNAVMLASPHTWLIGGLILLTSAIVGITAVTYDWEAANIDVWGTIKNIASVTIEKIKSGWQSLCDVLQPVIQAIGNTFNSVSGWIVENWETIMTVVSVVVGVFMVVGQVIWNVFTWASGAIKIVWEVLCTVWDILGGICKVIANVGQAVADNWGIISTILGAIGLAILSVVNVLLALVVVVALVTLGFALWNGVLVIWSALKTAAIGIMALFKAATWAQIWANIKLGISQAIANAPLWVTILIIGLLLVAIAWLISVILDWCGVSVSTAGVICGAFAWLAGTIWNIIVSVWNGILQFFDTVINIVIDVIEWFINAFGGGFDSFGSAVSNLLGKIISWFLSLGQVVTKIIDAIFGTNWTAGLESLKSKVLSWGASETKVTLKRDYLSRNVALERVNTTDWAKAGSEFGDNAGEKLSKLTSDIKDMGGDITSKFGGGIGDFGSGISDLFQGKDPTSAVTTDEDIKKALTGGGDNSALDRIAGDTGEIADNTGNLDSTSKDTKYLRELAEREAINRYTLTDLHVNMTNNNNLNSDVDVDNLGKRLWNALKSNARSTVPFNF